MKGAPSSKVSRGEGATPYKEPTFGGIPLSLYPLSNEEGPIGGFHSMTERNPLLVEREKTHGSFETNARISQKIKAIYASEGNYGSYLVVHQEALDMIALKLSRILSGQANFKDHWDDIAGYAKLGSEACE